MDFYPSLYDDGAEGISFSSSRKCGKPQTGFFDCGAEIVIHFVFWDFTKFNVVACILRESFASVKTELSAPLLPSDLPLPSKRLKRCARNV